MADLIFANGAWTGTATDSSPPVLTMSVAGKTGDLVVTAFMDFDIQMSKDENTWTQMDRQGKRRVPTTANNGINGSMIVDSTKFFGMTADATNVAGSASVLGIVRLVANSTRLALEFNLGAKVGTAEGYILSINPKAGSDTGRWETPVTIIIDGDISWT